MFEAILKILPKLDAAELSKMQRLLSSRFARLAKQFGKGLTSSIKGAFTGGAVLGLIDRLLNPIKDLQESLDRTLKKGDDLVTNAGQFNTTAGKLARLQAFGEATGLDSDNLFLLISKFQTAVAEAKADPNAPSAVRNFVGIEDGADAFFEFIQSLQKMNKSDQLLVQQSVFGEKQILKMSEFLQEDFAKLNDKFFKGISTETLSASANKIADLEGLDAGLRARRNLQDINTKGGILNEGMINSRNAAEVAALAKENERLKNFQDINALNLKMEKLVFEVEKLSTQILTQLPILMTGLEAAVGALKKSVEGWSIIIKAFKGSSIFKKFFGGDGE